MTVEAVADAPPGGAPTETAPANSGNALDVTLLKSAALRVTDVRLAVLAALETGAHADASAVFDRVRTQLPGTSLQAMYNALTDLTAANILRRIEPAGHSARYERRIGDNHHHIVCSVCGSIADVDCVVGDAPCLTPSNAMGYAVAAAEITFWGVCPECQATAAASTT